MTITLLKAKAKAQLELNKRLLKRFNSNKQIKEYRELLFKERGYKMALAFDDPMTTQELSAIIITTENKAGKFSSTIPIVTDLFKQKDYTKLVVLMNRLILGNAMPSINSEIVRIAKKKGLI